ncbi:MAG: GyrI-like domain-containing protein [Actinobacteria bacterium]|nr:GyrI-like domain-containing protein [Actinomycetota bacterium]
MEKLDLRKQLKHLYLPSAKEVSLIDVPEMKFLLVDGQIETGAMPGDSPSFAQAIGAMYGYAYTLKFMSKLRAENPIDYGVMALEGLWTTPVGGQDFEASPGWMWTLMVMQPDHIDDEMFVQARAQLKEKREKEARKAVRKAGAGGAGGAGPTPGAGSSGAAADLKSALAWLDRVRLESFREGLCVQVMHIGPYSDETRTLALMSAFAERNGYAFNGRHHEIYLGDPRTAKPENLKTVLRHPVHPVE